MLPKDERKDAGARVGRDRKYHMDDYELYRAFFESAQDGVFLMKEGQVVRCNAAAIRMHGRAKESEFIGAKPQDFSPARQPDGYDSAARAGEKIAAAESGTPQVFIWRHCRPDGSQFDVEVNLNRISDRSPSMLMVIERDVTTRLRAAEDLKNTQRRLSTLMDNLPGMAYRRRNDRNWTMEFVSRGCAELTGYDPSALINNAAIAFGDLIRPEHREEVYHAVQVALAAGAPFVIVYRISTRAGEEKWVWERGCRITEAPGEGVALEGFIADITEQRRMADEALGRERAFNETVIQTSPALFVAVKRDGRILAMNNTMLRLLGYTSEEVIGRDYLTTFVPPRERPAVRDTFDVLGSTRENTRSENHVLTKDGRELLIEWHGARIYSGRQVEYLIGLGLDITERRRAEQALQDSEERYSLSLEAANEGMWDWRRAGKETAYFSPRYYTMLEYEPGEFPASLAAWRELVHADDRPLAEATWRQCFEQTSDRFSVSFRMRAKSGRWVWVHSHGKVVQRDAAGSPVRIVGTHIDVTARKQAEAERERLIAEARAANSAKDRLLAVLSHELRNPLAAIQAGVELLNLTPLRKDPGVGRAIDIIARNNQLQARLVDDLLDLSRLAHGKVALRRGPLDLTSVVRASVHACRAEAARAKVAIEVRGGEPLWVDGDVDRLQQVVMNLLSNAVKFTPPGGRVTVSMSHVGDQARIAVADTGIGIDAKRLLSLFEMFEQGVIGSQRAPGLGIGLVLVKSLTEMHGGRVWAESAGPGRGSTFTIELPLTKGARAQTATPSTRLKRAPIDMLLVEDNLDTRTLLVEALAMRGYRVVPAETGEAALEVLNHETVEVIVADIGLPGMDGYELLRRIRQRPALRGVPAFAVTGYGQHKDVQRAREAGYAGHFVKPVDLGSLDQTIRKALGTSPIEDASG